MKHRRINLLFTATSLLWSVFIWSNSLKTAAESGEMSGGFLSFVNGILSNISPNLALTEHFIRKSAHFCEFAFLGILLALAVSLYCNKVRLPHILIPAVSAFSVATIDEFLQLFSDGRSCQFSDVMLDFSGACTGLLAVHLIFYLIRRKKRSRRTPSISR